LRKVIAFILVAWVALSVPYIIEGFIMADTGLVKFIDSLALMICMLNIYVAIKYAQTG